MGSRKSGAGVKCNLTIYQVSHITTGGKTNKQTQVALSTIHTILSLVRNL